ncbi:MAG: hypothetical protein JSV04_10845 [Candidatus Heimdallarchaeota archaeon]|nr:MAG: hypothetical protein JSV04_10845 [Candidatus Heimdallarchaeota archaeon]
MGLRNLFDTNLWLKIKYIPYLPTRSQFVKLLLIVSVIAGTFFVVTTFTYTEIIMGLINLLSYGVLFILFGITIHGFILILRILLAFKRK